MNKNLDLALGVLLRRKRENLGMSQAELSRKLGCPQPSVSRLEMGRRSATLRELAGLAQALGAPVSDLLAELEKTSSAALGNAQSKPEALTAAFSPVFHVALADEEAALAQLAAHGVRFLGGPVGPAVFKLNLEETLLAALKHAHEPRIFEALPSLLVQHCRGLDWTKLASGAFALQLQNRLGMVVAAALQLRKSCSAVLKETWETLQGVHDKLAEARLDREEVLGPKPKSQEALKFLAKRTPPWMRFWHGLGSVEIESLGRIPTDEIR